MSIFKLSCAAFWLIWMFILSFALGVSHFETKYTFLQEVDDVLIGLMLTASATSVAMAFVGCFCIKCDISHICCAFWYIVPSVSAVMTLCIYLILLCSKMPAHLEPGEVLRIIKSEFDTKNQIPSFLQYTQTHYRCCGVYGLKDFRMFILPSTIQQDVPFSCCHNLMDGQDDICNSISNPNPVIPDNDTLYDIFENQSTPGYTLPIPLPISGGKVNQQQLNTVILKFYGPQGIKRSGPPPPPRKKKRKSKLRKLIDRNKGPGSNESQSQSQDPDAADESSYTENDQDQTPNPELLTLDEQNLSPSEMMIKTRQIALRQALFLPVKPTKVQSILTTGCYEIMKKNGDMVINYCFGFGIFMMACSLLMAILFIQNCLKVRRHRKEEIQGFMESGRPPRESMLEPDFTPEEYKQILDDLQSPKKKLPVANDSGAGKTQPPGRPKRMEGSIASPGPSPGPTAAAKRL